MLQPRWPWVCALALAFLLLISGASGGPAAGAPMLQGGDSRDIAHTPAVTNMSRVTVRPGEGGAIAFDVTNRYNQTVFGVQVGLEFQVGGDWVNARPVAEIAAPPVFDRTTPVTPSELKENATAHFSFRFTTSTRTPSGPYLVSMLLNFSYRNASDVPTAAHFKSLGAIKSQDRDKVNMSDYNGTLAALGLDGFVPDTSIVVDGGEAMMLFTAAVAFGIAVIALGTAVGMYRSRRRRPSHRGKSS